MKKFLKIASNILTVIIVVIAVLLVITLFPITGNYKVLTVLSGSMEPAIHTGSVVVIKPVAEYQVGDVITFGKISKTQTPTTHRIHEIKDGKFITKGDANNAPDMKEVDPKEVMGKMLFSVPYAGYVISAVQKPVGFALIIIIPVIYIVYDEIRKIRNEIKKIIAKKKSKDASQDLEIDKAEEEIIRLKAEVERLEKEKNKN